MEGRTTAIDDRASENLGHADHLVRVVTAVAGVAFFALIIAHANLRSGAPSADASGSEIVGYITTHRTRLQLGAALLGLAMLAAAVWLSGVVLALERIGHYAAGRVALVGGTMAGVSTLAMALVQGSVTVRIDQLEVGDASLWWTIWLATTGMVLLGLALVIGAVSVAVVTREAFPNWFGISSLVLGVASVAGAQAMATDENTVHVVAALLIVLDSAWIMTTGVLLGRKGSLLPAPDDIGGGRRFEGWMPGGRERTLG